MESEPEKIRDHTAFLNSYAPEDEGLYDDYQCKATPEGSKQLAGGKRSAITGQNPLNKNIPKG